MDEFIPNADHFPPRYILMSFLKFIGDISCGFANDFDLTNYCIMRHRIREELIFRHTFGIFFDKINSVQNMT